MASERGDAARAKVHTLTINRLATGVITLTQDWMDILGEVFDVAPAEIIAPPPAQHLRRVPVILAFEARAWKRVAELPADEQYSTTVKDNDELRGLSLYAGEIRGQDCNLRYSPGDIVTMSRIEQKPGEIVEGRRYHVRVTRHDGAIEDTIKILGAVGDQYWLKPESNLPEFQEWLPLGGAPGLKVDLIGRLRAAWISED